MPASCPAAEKGPASYSASGVLAQLSELLVEVLGADLLLETAIDMETSFNDDLCLESIQFVVLAEGIRDRYGDDVDFVAWMAGMDLDAIIALRVGQLVEFIVRSVNGTDGG